MTLPAERYLAGIPIVTLAILIVLLVLPHDPYLRYRQPKGDFSKARWIYERIHFDDTSIEVAGFGSSHLYRGLDGAAVERRMSQHLGDTVHVANLAALFHGRDLQHVLLRQALLAQRPRLVILEVRESEGRVGHPWFAELADLEDAVSATWEPRGWYLANLNSIAARNLRLFLKEQILARTGQAPSFRPESYRGSHFFIPRNERLSRRNLERLRDEHLARKRWRVLPEDLAWLEFRFGRRYVERMVDLSRAAGARVAFLYLPFYGAPGEPQDAAFYRELGTLWIPPRAVIGDAVHWADVGHLNARGAAVLAEWLGDEIVGLLEP